MNDKNTAPARTTPSFLPVLARAFGAAALAVTVLASAAPVAGPNVNLMSGNKFPDGDPFLTKQNEPSIAVSSRNPRHLLAASNDYRTAALQTIEGVVGGRGWLSLYRSTNGGATWRPMLLAGCPVPFAECTGSNAALRGLEFSADPTLRPGPYGTFFFTFIAGRRDTSAGGVTAVQRFIDRNDAVQNGQNPFVADALNIMDSGTSGQFKDKPWVASDVPGRPWNAGATCDLRPHYGSGPVPAFNVYASFSNFVGNANGEGNPQLFVATSQDCGKTFGKAQKISESVKRNSGSSLTVDPATGHAYVVWRQFADSPGEPNGIYVSRSTDGGKRWTKPALVSNIQVFDQATTAASFRSTGFPSLAVSVDANGTSRVHVAWAERKAPIDPATAACTAPAGNCDARIVLVTSSDGGQSFPSRQFVDDWSFDPINPANPGRGHQVQPAITFAAGKLAVAWVDQRQTQTIGELRCTKAACTYPVDYTEVRVPVGALASCAPEAGGPSSAACVAGQSQAFKPFISDAGLARRHTVDTFVATATVATDGLLRFSSAPAAQYRYAQFDAATGGKCTASSANCVIRQTRFNVPNLPMFANGTRPFFGDYIDIAAQHIVPAGGTYKFNTGVNAATQVGGLKAAFHATWADARDVVPPKRNPDGSQNWANYQPLFNLDAVSAVISPNAQACSVGPGNQRVNNGQSGNRDQNVYTAVISDGWTAYANAPSKNLATNGTSAPRGFVVTVQNLEIAASGRFRLSATPGPGAQASFIYPGSGPALPSVDVDVARRSTATRTLWVTSTDPAATVTVLVENLDAPGDTTTLALNADRSDSLLGTADGRPDLANNNLWYPNTGLGVAGLANSVIFSTVASNELANVELANVELANVDLANAELANVELANVELANAELANVELANVELANVELANAELANVELANVELANGPVIESTVIVKNSGNTDTTLAVKPVLRNLPAGAKLQLVVRKIALDPVVGTSCVPEMVQRNAQVASIPSPRVYTPQNVDTSFPDVRTETDAATLPLSVNELAQVTLRIVGTNLSPEQALDFGRWGTKFVIVDARPSTVTTVPLVIKTLALPAVEAEAKPGVTIPSAPNGLQAIGGAPNSGLAWKVESVVPQAGFPAMPASAAVTVKADTGDLTVTNVPAGKYDLFVSVRDCAAVTCSVAPQQDLQKLSLTVTNISFAPPFPTELGTGASIRLPAATSGAGDPVTYVAPTDPALAPQQPNACEISASASGTPPAYTLTASNTPGTCTVLAWTGGATIALSVTVTNTIAVKKAQAITFPPVPAQTYAPAPNNTFAVSATTTGKDLAVTFSSNSPSVCLVSGSTVTIRTAGNCLIAADQAGNGLYLAAPQVPQTVTINKADQAITFGALAAKTFGDAPFTVSASGGASGNPVTFGAGNTSVCTVSGNSVALVGTGLCTIAANQAGNGNYLAAPQVAQPFTVGKAAQSIAFGALTARTFGDAPFTLSATGGASGTPVVFNSTTAGVCTVSGNTVTLIAAGSCTIAASQGGSPNYNPAAQVTQSFMVNKAAQTIDFPALSTQTYSPGATVGISATAKSGTTANGRLVAFSAGGSCTVSASTLAAGGASSATVTLTGGGTCTLTASEAGNANYEAATPAVQSFSIEKASQTITFAPLPDVTMPVAPFTVSATASSLLPVSFSSLTTGTCTVSGNTVTVTAAGTCTIAADQAGNTSYLAAPQVARSFAAKAAWVATGSLRQVRSGHTATLLDDGKVLVAGGLDASGAPTATSETYDPATGLFTAAGNLPSKSAGHTATLIDCACANDGKVLLVGGGNSSAGIYNPATRTWAATGGTGGNRSWHSATSLPGGKVLIAGGADNSDKPQASTLIFDPATGGFASGPSLAVARERHVAVTLADGRVLIAGGRAKSGNAYAVIASAEIYDPVQNRFVAAGNLAAGRHSADAARLADGRVLIAGGSADTTASGANALASTELYTPAPAAGSWASASQTPVLLTARRELTLTPLADGQALVAGGRNATGRLGLAEFYTVAPAAVGTFSAAPPMITPRSGHTATRLANGRVLVTGGVDSTGKSISAAEYYNSGP